jgi:hypothetical protein
MIELPYRQGRERERIIPNKILASDHPLLTHTRIIEHLLNCIMLSNKIVKTSRRKRYYQSAGRVKCLHVHDSLSLFSLVSQPQTWQILVILTSSKVKNFSHPSKNSNHWESYIYIKGPLFLANCNEHPVCFTSYSACLNDGRHLVIFSSNTLQLQLMFMKNIKTIRKLSLVTSAHLLGGVSSEFEFFYFIAVIQSFLFLIYEFNQQVQTKT